MLTPIKILSIFAFLLLVVGFLNRKRIRVHIPCMASAFFIDMGMLLYIEFTRKAIEQAIGPTSTIMKIHIAISVMLVLLYFGQVISGIRKARGKTSGWHKGGGLGLLACRFGNLATSFMISTH